MLVIALALVLVSVACAVLLTEASRTVVPLVGPSAILSQTANATETVTGPTVPTQRTPGDSARAAAAYGFIADLPAENSQGVQINL